MLLSTPFARSPLSSLSKVYRGLGKMLLPAQFWVPHGTPEWRGGVERAFMSTTADKSVALYYANGRGTVLEVSVGRIQNGGDISFLSMVPSSSFHTTFTVCKSHLIPALGKHTLHAFLTPMR
jgi:hypothetical protein